MAERDFLEKLGEWDAAERRQEVNDGLDSIKSCLEHLGNVDFRYVVGPTILAGPIAIAAFVYADKLNDTLQENLGKAWEIFLGLREKVVSLMLDFGDPITLNRVASEWGSLVASPVSKQAGWFDSNSAKLIYEWEGDAKEAYANTLPTQNAALTKIAEIAKGLNGPLTECANHIIDFWISVATTVVNFALEMAVTISGVLTPDVAGKPATFLRELARAIENAVDTMRQAMSDFLVRFSNIEDLLNSYEAFPGGEWPRPNARTISNRDRWEG